jgi:hypothetical protein
MQLLLVITLTAFFAAAISYLSDGKRRHTIERLEAASATPDSIAAEAILAGVRDDLARAAMPWAEYRGGHGHEYRTWKATPAKRAA